MMYSSNKIEFPPSLKLFCDMFIVFEVIPSPAVLYYLKLLVPRIYHHGSTMEAIHRCIRD
jgi:hypothetical protein